MMRKHCAWSGTACLALLLHTSGCGGEHEVAARVERLDHRAVQPLEILPAAETEPPAIGLAPEHLDPLLEHNPGAAVEPAGLAGSYDPERRGWIVAEPSDLATSVDQAQPAIVFGPESRGFATCVRDDRCLRLVTYPEGEPVAAERRSPEPGYGDISRRIVLVPTEPLEARWYAVELRVEGSVGETTRVGDIQIARFRPDSHPIVSHVLLGRRNGRVVLDLRFSERLSGPTPAERWRVASADGRTMPCEVLGPAPGREEHHAVFTCDELGSAYATIDFGGRLRTVLGTELRDRDEIALTSVRVPFEEPPERGFVRVSLHDP
jgi:hypothetical protein